MSKTIESWEDLQKNVTKIVAALNRNQNLLIAAAANPILALEELGFSIKPEILPEIEDKLRFKSSEIGKLDKLRKSVHKIAGKSFSLRSEEDLNRVLFEELDITAYDDSGCPIRKRIQVRRKGDDDDLLVYKELHPIIKPLMAFRDIDASINGFSDARTYQQIRNGKYGEDSNVTLKIQLKKRTTKKR